MRQLIHNLSTGADTNGRSEYTTIVTAPYFLIADDSPVKTDMLLKAIHAEEWDIEIAAAGTTKQAYEVMKKRRVDFAFIDYYIPDDNGPRVIERLKMRNKKARIALVSSSKKPSNFAEATAAGAEICICVSDPAHIVAEQLSSLLRDWMMSGTMDA